ncbi:hypothetical protein [Halogeometricum borinquense]|nr:hypothetical protein [Halogeometricum borinquense]
MSHGAAPIRFRDGFGERRAEPGTRRVESVGGGPDPPRLTRPDAT